jgi:hypothetical protein
MAKLAHTELPKMARGTRKELDKATVQEAIADLRESFDFAPHAYTDGKEYATYSEAVSVANLTKRDAAAGLGIPRNMVRQRIWEVTGKQDRKQKGKWIFALSQRTSPPKPRAASENGNGDNA